MKKILFVLFLMVFALSACNTSENNVSTTPNAPISYSTETPIPPTTTLEPSPTPTITPDPLLGAPEGTTGINEQGQWTKKTTEGEITFEWIWDKSLESWVRPLITQYHLLDSPNDKEDTFNYQVFIKDDVPGGNAFIEFAHENVISPDDESPFGCSSCGSYLHFRLATRFNNQHGRSLTNEEWDKFYEFMKQEDKYLPLILPSGEKANIRISQESGIILTIVTPEDLTPLVEEKKARKFTSINEGITEYISIDEVDKDGNVNCRVATNIPLDKLWDIYLSGKKVEDYHFRALIYLCVSNILTSEDQTDLLAFSDASVYAQQSARLRANGKPDLVIVRAP